MVEAALEPGERYDALAVAYADCGTYGALDEVLDGVRARLAGDHCYDVIAGRGARRSRRSRAPTC